MFKAKAPTQNPRQTDALMTTLSAEEIREIQMASTERLSGGGEVHHFDLFANEIQSRLLEKNLPKFAAILRMADMIRDLGGPSTQEVETVEANTIDLVNRMLRQMASDQLAQQLDSFGGWSDHTLKTGIHDEGFLVDVIPKDADTGAEPQPVLSSFTEVVDGVPVLRVYHGATEECLMSIFAEPDGPILRPDDGFDTVRMETDYMPRARDGREGQ